MSPDSRPSIRLSHASLTIACTKPYGAAKESDAFIALPGGFGTLEELLEVITWQQLGYHSKPVGVLNIGGYFDLFLAFLDKSVETGFISPIARSIVVTASTPGKLIDAMEKYEVAQSRIVAPEEKAH